MSNHVYRLSEIVGSSPTSIDDAIRTGIGKAASISPPTCPAMTEWVPASPVGPHVAAGAPGAGPRRRAAGRRA